MGNSLWEGADVLDGGPPNLSRQHGTRAVHAGIMVR